MRAVLGPSWLVALILVLFLVSVDSPAQGRTCGTMDNLAMLLLQDPKMAARMAAIEQQTQGFLGNLPPPGQDVVYTIPVVVHVVWNSAVENISQAQIDSQIAVLNEDFRRQNPDAGNTPASFLPVAADSEIAFCLANRDPSGAATNGVTRTQTSVPSFGTNNNVKFSASGGHEAWPSSSYLNIWVCDLSGGLLGYAQFPGGSPATDGVVIDYQAFGRTGTAAYPFHLGRTATHEVGHWFNLRHIWGDGPCGVDDFVADTPESDAANFGCATGHVSCGSVDMVQNYMDYSDDACFNLYTLGQKNRMRALFNPGGARQSLLSSSGCQPALPEYQVNQPEATLTIGGVVGTATAPAVTMACPGSGGTVSLASVPANIGLPYDLGISLLPLVPASSGGLITPGGQKVNLDLGAVIFLGSGSSLPGLPPWPGNWGFPYVAGAFATVSLQMVMLDASFADGLVLSQGAQLDLVTGQGFPAGPAGDDSNVTLTLGGNTCLSPVAFYGVLYNQVHVSSNGRILFVGPDTDYSPSISEGLTDSPFVGFWTDLDPSAGGSISFSSPGAGLLRVGFTGVRYYAEPSSASSFAVEFDTSSNTVTLDGLAGIVPNPRTNTAASAGDAQFLGITKGNTGASNLGTTLFSAGGSGTAPSATSMLYDWFAGTSAGLVPSLSGTSLNRIVFTPLPSGNYSWMGF